MIPENHDNGREERGARGWATIFLEDAEAWCRRVWKEDCDTSVAVEGSDTASDRGIVDSSQRSWMHPWTHFFLFFIVTHEKKKTVTLHLLRVAMKQLTGTRLVPSEKPAQITATTLCASSTQLVQSQICGTHIWYYRWIHLRTFYDLLLRLLLQATQLVRQDIFGKSPARSR